MLLLKCKQKKISALFISERRKYTAQTVCGLLLSALHTPLGTSKLCTRGKLFTQGYLTHCKFATLISPRVRYYHRDNVCVRIPGLLFFLVAISNRGEIIAFPNFPLSSWFLRWKLSSHCRCSKFRLEIRLPKIGTHRRQKNGIHNGKEVFSGAVCVCVLHVMREKQLAPPVGGDVSQQHMRCERE